MTAHIIIRRATAKDVPEVAKLVGELLSEIMHITGELAFNFNVADTATRLKDSINREKYIVFVAQSNNAEPVGFIVIYESYALYAEGAFGTIPELYVHPDFRSQNVEQCLEEQAKSYGKLRGWKRLEGTTPPLPQFDKTIAFFCGRGLLLQGDGS